MSDDKQPETNESRLPSMGGKTKPHRMNADETRSALSVANKRLDKVAERTAGQDSRDTELSDRELEIQTKEARLNERAAELDARGIDPNPAPIAQAAPANREFKGDNPKAIRRQMSQGKRLDATIYELEYPEKKLMWVNDMNGDVQRWIDAGAEPVPVKTANARTFEGITDKSESKWARSVGGDDGMGGHYYVYLLMMSPERYDEVELQPLRDRQAAIKRSMTKGKDASDGAGGELESYAPNLPTGGRGFEQIKDHLVGRG